MVYKVVITHEVEQKKNNKISRAGDALDIKKYILIKLFAFMSALAKTYSTATIMFRDVELVEFVVY